MAAAKTNEERNIVKQNATADLRSCNNILLANDSAFAFEHQKINLSRIEATVTLSRKRGAATAGNGSGTYLNKRGLGTGFTQKQLVSYSVFVIIKPKQQGMRNACAFKLLRFQK
ncbi:hypothetical protein POM88_017460 [Heracleum sosnowskyi]|uniref:Uncharacterized protein n=1 Tax=Heracleum sosnowskyi TaxID=360622 RepID=A0AAD8MYC3_9APIA|nr:hypothetical protein POM88_017460 [Heracleum sosnowskyi]